MKKTVSINIGSIIFHIEEDGYDKLKNYLDSVNKYFSSFEDSQEIISDIESRVAEIFLAKLADGRQTVNIEDVEDLISTMGTTQDFKATIESEPEPTTAKETSQPKQEESKTEDSQATSHGSKRMYRDMKRRILGGVASGIAYYFSIDPLWIRLLFVALFINLLQIGFSTTTALVYIILWIVLPENSELEDDKKIKKLFRNPDDRVLGGISGGIAAYFGSNSSVIRLIFVVSAILSFGATIFAYLILWLITPEARSITEKMQMQGEPFTISNIEENVKRGLNLKEGEETPLVKILLFPFRFIALVINALSKILGPALKFIVELIRIAFGVILALSGFGLMLGWTAALLALFGFANWKEFMHIGSFPLDLIQNSIDPWMLASAFIVVFIPALTLTLLGLVIILKRRVVNAYVGWSLFALWIIALITSSFAIPGFAREFSSEEDIRVEKEFAATPDTPTLKLNDLDVGSFGEVELRLRGHKDSTYQLILNIESRGSSRDNAKDNAEKVIYNVTRETGDFYFDSNITFPEGTSYRFQNVDAMFYIPYGKEFKIDYELKDILVNTLHLNGYNSSQIGEKNTWVYTDKGLECVTCSEKSSRNYDYEDDDFRSSNSNSSDLEKIDYPFEDFDEVTISSFFDILIDQGDVWNVTVKGNNEELDEVYLNQVGNRLEVNYREDDWEWWKDQSSDKPILYITMPALEYLQVVGDCDGEVTGFQNNEMNVKMTGASDIYMNVDVEDLELKLTGASQVELRGYGHHLHVEIIGASKFEGYQFRADRASIKAVGASKAEVFASEEIDIDAAGMSKVKYRGTNKVSINSSGVSTVSKD